VSPADIAKIISEGRYDLSAEKACQRDMDFHLAACLPLSVGVRREHRLGPGDIPDFYITGGIVVEVKAGRASTGPTVRQLERYAAYESVSALILATSRSLDVPAEIGGKPVLVVDLGRAWF
jgi:hypothetical protein